MIHPQDPDDMDVNPGAGRKRARQRGGTANAEGFMTVDGSRRNESWGRSSGDGGGIGSEGAGGVASPGTGPGTCTTSTTTTQNKTAVSSDGCRHAKNEKNEKAKQISTPAMHLRDVSRSAQV